MANEITGASLNGIYNRLNNVPQYHPLAADTFSDWSMEAGDIVTVTRDGRSYKSPVHSSRMVWKGGAPKVSVNSTGNEKREAVSKVSRKKYGKGSAGLRNSQKTFQAIETSYNEMTSGLILASSSAALYVDNKYNQMRAGLNLTSSSAALYVDNKYAQMRAGLNLTSSSASLYVDNKYAQMRAGLDLTSSSASLYVDNKYAQMRAGLDLTSSSAALYVDNKYAQMRAGLSLTSSSAALYVDNKYAQMRAGLNMTSSHASLYVDNKYNQMIAGLGLTSSSAVLYVDSKYDQMKSGLSLTSSSAALYVDNKYTQMTAGLKLTSSSAALYVNDKYSQMSSGLGLTSSSAALYVDSKYNQMKSGLDITMSSATLYARSAENAAEIAARINESTGQSEIHLNADKVYIGTSKSTTVIGGKLNATEFNSTNIKSLIAEIAIVDAQTIKATSLQFWNGGTTYTSVRELIDAYKIVKTGNNYKLQYKRLNSTEWYDAPNSETFSRAVSSWTWAGGDGQVKVTAHPQEETLGVDVAVYGNDTITSNGTYIYKVQYEDSEGSYWDVEDTEKTVTVSISPRTASSITPYYWGGLTYDSGVGAWVKALYYDVNYSDGSGATRIQNPQWLSVQDAINTGISAYHDSQYWGIDASHNVLRPNSSVNATEVWFNILTVNDNAYVTRADYNARYKTGFNADHSMFIAVGSHSNKYTSYNLSYGETVNVWPGFCTQDGGGNPDADENVGKQWGSACSVKAPSRGTGIPVTCTAKSDISGGQGTAYRYTFSCDLGTNVAEFNANTNYTLYKQ